MPIAMLLAMVIAVQGNSETLPTDYLDTGRLWNRAPERPIGPVSPDVVYSYFSTMANTRVPAYANGRPPAKVDPGILRVCLTETSAQLLKRLPSASGVLLRELIVEVHRRRVPERGPVLLKLVKQNQVTSDTRAVHFAAQAITALGGDPARDGAAALTEHSDGSVRMVGFVHLAHLKDPRAMKGLVLAFDGEHVRSLDAECFSYLVRRGYADTEAGFECILSFYWSCRPVIESLVSRNAATVNRNLIKVAGDRKAYHGVKATMIKAMNKVDSPRHTPALRQMLGDSWALVRIAAARELVRRKDRASLPLMRKVLTMKDEQNRVNGTNHDSRPDMQECIRQLESL